MRSDGERVAVITGGASGLGRALALALGQQAWTVVVTDIDEGGARDTLDALRGRGGEGISRALDVRDPEAFEALAEEVFGRWGRLDLLINNAGVAATGEVGKVSLEDWRWCLDIDLYGPIHGCHAFAPRMRAQGFGQIVNIASIAGFALGARMGPYNVAKAGVVALSETLRAELLGTGVGVTVVCPGFFATNIARNMRVTSDREREKTVALIEGSGLGADQVAARILAAARRNTPILVLPFDALVIFWLRRLFPARATEIMREMIARRAPRGPAAPRDAR